MTIQELLAQATADLAAIGIQNASQEGGWILAHVLGIETQQLQIIPHTRVDQDKLESALRLVTRRRRGEPLQYILGTTEFHGLELRVGPGVLVPRPETERLVDFALERDPGYGPICDLCTGSGAIPLALASQLDDRRPITGLDLSPDALSYACRNAEDLNIDNVEFLLSDLWAQIAPSAQFALVTANPPYVTRDEYADLPTDVRDHEPSLALLAENDGLAIIERIARESWPYMAPGAWLLCEIGSEQGTAARIIFEQEGWQRVRVRQDYARRDRVLEAQKQPLD